MSLFYFSSRITTGRLYLAGEVLLPSVATVSSLAFQAANVEGDKVSGVYGETRSIMIFSFINRDYT